MRYVTTRYVEYQKEMAYRFFVTDCLWESKDHEKVYYAERYRYIIDSHKKPIERSADDIAKDVINNAGLVVK